MLDMNVLDGVLKVLADTAAASAENPALKYIGAGLAVLTGAGSGVGEGLICAHAVDGMARNPEMASKLRTSMILGCALTETTGIYGLVIAILCLVM